MILNSGERYFLPHFIQHVMVLRYSPLRAIKLLLIALGTGLVLLAPAGAVLAQSRILFVGNSFTHGFVAPVLILIANRSAKEVG